MSAPPPRKPRPELPRGPFLVVGLARSGVAVARMLLARGEEVIGVDSGHPAGAEGLTGLGVEVSLDGQGIEHLERVRTVVKSPGVPREAPVIEAALRRGVEVTGELELAWRAIPNSFAGPFRRRCARRWKRRFRCAGRSRPCRRRTPRVPYR